MNPTTPNPLKTKMAENEEKWADFYEEIVRESGLIPTRSFFLETLDTYRGEVLEALLEALPGEKEKLDKDDPDNYGACYAIGGFNGCLAQVRAIINSALEK